MTNPLHHVAQLAHVARPRIAQQHLHGVVAHLLVAAAVGGGEFVQKVPGQQRNIFAALAQRRNKKWNHVQPVEKILAKIPLADFFFQVFVGGRDHARVHRHRLFASDRHERGLRRACAAPCSASSGSCRPLRPETACRRRPSGICRPCRCWRRGTRPCTGRTARSRSCPRESPRS